MGASLEAITEKLSLDAPGVQCLVSDGSRAAGLNGMTAEQ